MWCAISSATSRSFATGWACRNRFARPRISSRSWLSMGTPFLDVHPRRAPPPTDTGDPARTPRRPAADLQPIGRQRIAEPRMAPRTGPDETERMVRVIVVDDEELVRSGFRLILQAA